MTVAFLIGPSFVGSHAEAVHPVDIADQTVLLHKPSAELHLLTPSVALVSHVRGHSRADQ